MSKEQFHSRVYTDRPAYADFAAPEKFEAIKSIVAKRLVEHPNAICSYSGGSDSDIMLHLIEEVRHTFDLPPMKWRLQSVTSARRQISTALKLQNIARRKILCWRQESMDNHLYQK